MRCDECMPLLEEFVDGELGAREASLVAAHVAGCEACSGAAEELRRELELYARYERDVEVTPALWSAVRARIEEEKGSAVEARPERVGVVARLRAAVASLFGERRFAPALAAAFALLLVAGAVYTLRSARSGGEGPGEVVQAPPPDETSAPPAPPTDGTKEPTPPSQGAEKPLPRDEVARHGRPRASRAAPKAAPKPLFHEAEQKYLDAIALLSRDAERARPRLDPGLVSSVDRSLAELDLAIASTRQSARENPDDPIAVQYLLTAYSKKLEVLQEVATR